MFVEPSGRGGSLCRKAQQTAFLSYRIVIIPLGTFLSYRIVIAYRLLIVHRSRVLICWELVLYFLLHFCRSCINLPESSVFFRSLQRKTIEQVAYQVVTVRVSALNHLIALLERHVFESEMHHEGNHTSIVELRSLQFVKRTQIVCRVRNKDA